ncbi:L-pipecolate oxidase [Psilocybe cubensis]|uniref:L-pipecolate oxidase n=2 Tax=Psilocybe cubensis TaxID=181762 RepID=A0ACB8HBV0_PSICU|nr:L-pipecolate oxidase [Psilocybe cubensis]KAH9485485.1 L-pipecolate oxidase [Psilocybe cubensis]
MVLLKHEKVVIVGAGCFGISTAYHLLQRGYTDVTVLDRSTVLPAPDAASNDLNRVVRSSYDDAFYARLAREAILSWKDRKAWGDTYHESGVVVLGDSGPGKETYADKSLQNDIAMGATVKVLKDSNAIRSLFPPQVNTGSFENCAGYLNSDGGWANAGQGLAIMIGKVRDLSGKVVPGKSVVKILREEDGLTGVECSDGTVVEASLVIIASGSWTPSLFPELGLESMCLATGQCVAMIQLSDSEADVYRDCPVVVDFSSGFYIFPPNAGNVVKMAFHSAGFTHFDETNGTISTPRTLTSNPTDGLLIPRDSLQDMRTYLGKIYPDLTRKPFSATRLCWYNDSPDGNWVIGRHPKNQNIIIATGGSGHAYKFLPVIGSLVADVVADELKAELVAKFALDRVISQVDASRSGAAKKLDINTFYSIEDLQPR